MIQLGHTNTKVVYQCMKNIHAVSNFLYIANYASSLILDTLEQQKQLAIECKSSVLSDAVRGFIDLYFQDHALLIDRLIDQTSYINNINSNLDFYIQSVSDLLGNNYFINMDLNYVRTLNLYQNNYLHVATFLQAILANETLDQTIDLIYEVKNIVDINLLFVERAIIDLKYYTLTND